MRLKFYARNLDRAIFTGLDTGGGLGVCLLLGEVEVLCDGTSTLLKTFQLR